MKKYRYGVDWAKTVKAKSIFSEKNYAKIKTAKKSFSEKDDSEKLAPKERRAKTEVDREPAVVEIIESPSQNFDYIHFEIYYGSQFVYTLSIFLILSSHLPVTTNWMISLSAALAMMFINYFTSPKCLYFE